MRRQKYSNLASKLQPYLNNAPAVAVSTTPPSGAHVHTFADLGGTLLESQAPWVLEAIAGIKPHGLIDATWHTVTGSAGSVIGLAADNVAGVLPTTSDGAANVNTILRSGAAGELGVASLAVGAGKVLADATRLQTDNYTSQLAGWRHTYTGEFDTRYIFANEMKIVKFIADMQQALAGSQIVSKSVTTLAETFFAPRPGGSSFLTVDDLPSAEGMPVFESGDIVLVTQDSRESGGFSSVRCWGVVTDYFDLPDKKQRWFFTRSGEFGLSVPTFTGPQQTASSSTSSLAVTKVTGTVSGNLSIACVLVESTTVTTTPPAGWTLIQNSTVTGMRLLLYTKKAGGSEPASYTWTHSSSVDSMVILLNLTNQDPTAPLSASIAWPQETATSFSVIKSLTPVSNYDYYLGFVAARANRHPVIQPDGWNLIHSSTFGSNTLAAMSVGTDTYAGIPFGDVAATLTGGTARTISFTLNIIPKPIPLTLETGFMPIDTQVAKGAFILDYGVSGNGWHEITAIDGIYGGNSPYSRVVQWTGHPATGAVVRTQDGNLKGIFGASNEFGFFAGDGVTVNNKYIRISNLGAKFNNIPIELYTAGVQKVNIDSGGVNLWIGTSSADKRLTWDGATLSVKGAIEISSPSAFSGSGYLQIGSGVKDSTLTGFNLSSAEIVGQASGLDQVVMGLDGKLTAGAGAVWLDRNGFNVAVGLIGVPTAFRFDSAGSALGSIGFIRQAGPVPASADGMIFNVANSTKYRFLGASSAEFAMPLTVSGSITATSLLVNGPSALASTTGLTGTKASVAHNVATALCRITIGGADTLAAGYLVSVTLRSASTSSAVTYTVSHGWNQATVTEHAKAMFGHSAITLTAAADTANRRITLTLTQLNGSSEAATVQVSVLPICVTANAQITLTML